VIHRVKCYVGYIGMEYLIEIACPGT